MLESGSSPFDSVWSADRTESYVIVTGFALFSMFFGAGNLLYPLVLGQLCGQAVPFGLVGWSITSVGLPLLGLITMTLYRGNYRAFFAPLGAWPRFCLLLLILMLIGPFGAIPRCITFAHASCARFLPACPLSLFSLVFCALLYLLAQRPEKVVQQLGYLLAPLLLCSLTVLFIQGFLTVEELTPNSAPAFEAFFLGVDRGYQTMDLLGAFFFSSLLFFPQNKVEPSTSDELMATVKACSLAGVLLLASYGGLAYLGAAHAEQLASIDAEQFFAQVAWLTLERSYRAAIACTIVLLCCVTTGVALISLFARFIQEEVSCSNVSYRACLLISLSITFALSTLHFAGIALLLEPLIYLCYPALIVLTLCNLAHQVWGWKMICTPFYIALAITCLLYGLL